MENIGGMMSREKLLAQGASSLADAELLALFLRIDMQGKGMLTLAKEILRYFESLYDLLYVDYMDLSYVQGIDITKYTQLEGIAELARRYYKVRVIEKRALLSPEMAQEFLQSQLSQEEREIFLVIFVDPQHRTVKHSKPFSGTLSHVEVHPREIAREVTKMDVSTVILTHSHPPGRVESSKADKLITERVVKCCQSMDIRVLNHLVIGRGGYASSAECGQI